jgi:hypothetical protein
VGPAGPQGPPGPPGSTRPPEPTVIGSVTLAPLGTFDLYEFSFSASAPVAVSGTGASAGRAEFGELTILVPNAPAFARFLSYDVIAGAPTLGPIPAITEVSVRPLSQPLPFLTGTQAVFVLGFALRVRTSTASPELLRLSLALGAATLTAGGNLAGWSVVNNNTNTGFTAPPLMGPATCVPSGIAPVSLITQLPPALAPTDGGTLMDDGTYSGSTAVTFGSGGTAQAGRFTYSDASFVGTFDPTGVCLFRYLVTGRTVRVTNVRQAAAGFVSKVTSERAFINRIAYESTPDGVIRQNVNLTLGDATVSFTP